MTGTVQPPQAVRQPHTPCDARKSPPHTQKALAEAACPPAHGQQRAAQAHWEHPWKLSPVGAWFPVPRPEEAASARVLGRPCGTQPFSAGSNTLFRLNAVNCPVSASSLAHQMSSWAVAGDLSSHTYGSGGGGPCAGVISGQPPPASTGAPSWAASDTGCSKWPLEGAKGNFGVQLPHHCFQQ